MPSADTPRRPVALAAAAHPDDIEFLFAGTLLRLKQAGCEIHYWNLANGSCGTAEHDKTEIIRLRRAEAEASATLAEAIYHPPLCDDLMVYYIPDLVARAAAVVREVKPTLMLIPSPQDYMEDHTNTCRILVTAAFVRGMRNFACQPPTPPWDGQTVLYHGLPHGLRDGLRRLVRSGQYVDIEPVLDTKREMLRQHETQKNWLDASQGIGAYLSEMENMCRTIGEMSGQFAFAEGWRRHSHLGFAGPDDDPLSDLLGDACWTVQEYEEGLG
jgi:LmbE family N-acetylglucosaminyl deacetylase